MNGSMASEPTLSDRLDADSMAVTIRAVLWLTGQWGIPSPIAKGAVGAILSAPVPATLVLDRSGLVPIAQHVLIGYLSAAGYPTDPDQWSRPTGGQSASKA